MTKTDEHRIAEMFDGIAHRYDFLNHLLSWGQDFRWRRYLAACVEDDASLLDVATGTGDVILACQRNRKKPPRCTGIDISRNMLDLARRKLSSEVNLHCMSAEKLKFPDNSFSYVTVAFGLRNVIDKEKALAEFYRVLQKNGQLIILEFFRLDKKDFKSKIFSFYIHAILPRIAALFSNRESYHYLPASVERFYLGKELLDLTTTHGFRLDKQKWFLHGSVGLIALRKS